MSRKNHRPQYHEPVSDAPVMGRQTEAVVEAFDPIEDTIEVGAVILVDGPIDPVPLGTSPREREDCYPPHYSTGPMPNLGAASEGVTAAKGKTQNAVQGVAQAAQDAGRKAQDVVQDVNQQVQDTSKSIVAKAQDVAQSVADKAQDVTQKVTDKASAAKAAAGDALGSAKAATPAAKSVLAGAASRIGTAGASGAQSVGSALWLLIQRNPLQAIFVITSVIWLFRNNKATASQPPVSLTDAAEKVGTVAGHVQVAATNLSAQVSAQVSRNAGWFGKTLHENPLAIGAMAVVFGAGLGFSVPESGYENKLLGKTRDALADKVQAAAQDLTQKVTTVAQTAAHEAVESAKAEAKNQGLTAEAVAPAQPQTPDQSQDQTQAS